MGRSRSLVATAVVTLLLSAAIQAAPITVNGATFDAPSSYPIGAGQPSQARRFCS